MTSLKKKPKPFSAMKKVLCGDVQSRRLMVFASLVLVLLGCFALYSAMQNEEWTQDEPTQRRVFFLASLLLISSIALCYYALNGELVEESELLEAEYLTSVKCGHYNTMKPDTLATCPQPQTINSGMEDKLLKLLEPGDYQSNSIKNVSGTSANGFNCERSNYQQSQERRNLINTSKAEVHFPAATEKSVAIPAKDSSEDRNKNLIVELMPLMTMQLCDKVLEDLGIPSQSVKSERGQAYEFPLPNNRFQPDLTKPLSSVNNNSDAG